MSVATTKISVSVDREILAEVKQLEGADVNVSRIMDEALRARAARLKLLALLDRWERDAPIGAKGRKLGEDMWRRAHE